MSSDTLQIISEAAPKEFHPGSATTKRPVFLTDRFIVSVSKGESVLGSITSCSSLLL